jgi:chromosome partitioning protein
VPRSFVVLNRKGGSNKTSICYSLGSEMARRGYRLLLLDTDAQRNLTDKLLMDSVTGEIPVIPYEKSIAALFDETVYVRDRSSLIVDTRIPNVSLLPAHIRFEHQSRGDPSLDNRQRVLRDFLAEVRDQFDYIICDCPPNVLLGSWSALVASDAVITPLIPEDFGAMGLKLLNESFLQVRKVNPSLALLGYILTMVDIKSPLHKAYARTIRDSYGELVFETEIPVLRDMKWSITMARPITTYKPKSKASKVIMQLCDELLSRDSVLVNGK